MYNWALRHVPVLLVSVSFLGEPPLAAVLALLILASVPSFATVAGGVLILAGLALALVEPGARSGPADSRSHSDRADRVRPHRRGGGDPLRRERSRDRRHLHHRALSPVRSGADRPGTVATRSSMATTRSGYHSTTKRYRGGMDRVLSLVHRSRIRTIERLRRRRRERARHRMRARGAHQSDALARVAGARHRTIPVGRAAGARCLPSRRERGGRRLSSWRRAPPTTRWSSGTSPSTSTRRRRRCAASHGCSVRVGSCSSRCRTSRPRRRGSGAPGGSTSTSRGTWSTSRHRR